MGMVGFRQLMNVGGVLGIFCWAMTSTIASAGSVSFPIYVPQECVSLAQREGVPTVLQNRYQAAKAKLKLARLDGSDPMVRECRAAVRRAAVMIKREQMAEKERSKFARAAATE